MDNKEIVIVLDFGGQYNQLIARRVRECNVYCEILPYTVDIKKVKELSPKGIIFTGGPNSVYDERSPHYSNEIFKLGIPILGICYGCQLMAYSLGGVVTPAKDNSSSEQQFALRRLWLALKKSFTEFSSIRRSITRTGARKCLGLSSIKYAAVKANGRWKALLIPPLPN